MGPVRSRDCHWHTFGAGPTISIAALVEKLAFCVNVMGMAGRLVGVEAPVVRQSGGRSQGSKPAPVVHFSSNIETVYRNDLNRLVGLAEWIVGSRMVAEEIVHDSFARIVERPPRLDDPTALSAYVRATVVNGCRSKVKRAVLERKHAKASAEVHTDPERPNEHIRRAIGELPIRQRQVVVLRFYEDLTVEQIASTLNISSGSVKTHLHRATQRLGTLLDERTEP